MEKKSIKKTTRSTKKGANKIVIRRQYQEYPGELGSINSQPSKTVPDQNISLQQLLLNHTRGNHSTSNYHEGIYSGTEIPVIEDLNDVAEYREKNKLEQERLEQEAKKEHENAKEKREAKAKLEAKAEILEEIQNKEDTETKKEK